MPQRHASGVGGPRSAVRGLELAGWRGQYATTISKRAPMSEELVARKVAEQIAAFYPQPFTVDQAMALIEERCGRFARGRHKGQLSGHLPIGCSTPGACQ